MTSVLLLLWALTGGGISSAIMMLIWLPDPPPDVVVRFFSTLVAGIVGGVAGGYLVHGSFAGSDPMPAIVASAGAGAILSAGVALLSGGRGKAAH